MTKTTQFFITAYALAVVFFTTEVAALQCWKCSSDVDRICNDPFNETEILNRRGGGNFYDRLQPDRGQNYDPNYNPSFNPNFNPNFNLQTPSLEQCDEREANLRRMKNVCLKKVIKGNNYVNVIRRCALIGFNEEIGTCNDPVTRGLNTEFCEYCDREGCNSAFGIKANVLLASLLSLGVIFLRQ